MTIRDSLKKQYMVICSNFISVKDVCLVENFLVKIIKSFSLRTCLHLLRHVHFPESYTLKNQRLKITQLEKAHFIQVNELKLTQLELFKFFHFMCVAANASELFCMT